MTVKLKTELRSPMNPKQEYKKKSTLKPILIKLLKKHTYRENIKIIQIEKIQISLEGGTIRLMADSQ